MSAGPPMDRRADAGSRALFDRMAEVTEAAAHRGAKSGALEVLNGFTDHDLTAESGRTEFRKDLRHASTLREWCERFKENAFRAVVTALCVAAVGAVLAMVNWGGVGG